MGREQALLAGQGRRQQSPTRPGSVLDGNSRSGRGVDSRACVCAGVCVRVCVCACMCVSEQCARGVQAWKLR